jgi:hypothetical protein
LKRNNIKQRKIHMHKKMRDIETTIKSLGAVSAIVLPGFVTATWTNKDSAEKFARTLTRVDASPEVFADPSDNGNWIVSASIR